MEINIGQSLKNLLDNAASFLTPENVGKYFLGTKKGHPRSVYDIYLDHRDEPVKRKKKKKKQHRRNYDPYFVLPMKKRKRRKK